MRYFFRFIIYIIIFFGTFSISYAFVMGFIPITLTPLKVIKLFENTKHGFIVRSNWTSIDNINISVPTAVIATEDNNFLIHNGFDWEAIDSAIKSSQRGKRLRGASTISQQTAKNVFCTHSRNWFRKGFETYYTILIEQLWSKERIMEAYLNIIETGPNMYGVKAPAKYIFDKKAAELNAYDASLIATVLPNPIRMRLDRPSTYMRNRAANVRSLMNMLPKVDFDDTSEWEKLQKKKRKR